MQSDQNHDTFKSKIHFYRLTLKLPNIFEVVNSAGCGAFYYKKIDSVLFFIIYNLYAYDILIFLLFSV